MYYLVAWIWIIFVIIICKKFYRNIKEQIKMILLTFIIGVISIILSIYVNIILGSIIEVFDVAYMFAVINSIKNNKSRE